VCLRAFSLGHLCGGLLEGWATRYIFSRVACVVGAKWVSSALRLVTLVAGVEHAFVPFPLGYLCSEL
jgi:hypothetical protein